MNRYRYSRWDGTQELGPLDADDAMEHVADEMLEHGDLRAALRRMLQRGAEFPSGRRMMGLQEIRERLERARERNLGQYDLGSILDEIKERLDRIIETEQNTLRQRMDQETDRLLPEGEQSQAGDEAPGPQEGATAPVGQDAQPSQEAGDSSFNELLHRMAQRRLDQLESLPPGVGGRIQGLREYEFLDPEARRQYEDLLQVLQQQVMQGSFQGMQQSLQSMTPEALQGLQQMMQDLNRLLEGRQRGEAGDFDEFMQKWGENFLKGIENIDQLADHIQRQMAQMESLLSSMTPDMRRQLEEMVDSLFPQQLQGEMARLAANLQQMYPMHGGPNDFPFSGDEPLSLQEAMGLMGDMNRMEELDRELMQALRSNDASRVDSEEVGQLLGEEARQILEQLQELAKTLEEAGFIQRRGEGWELTPRAVRRIGQRALQDIFARLKRGPTGAHVLDRRGIGVELLEETKPYVYGDPFHMDVKGTVMNAVVRQGQGTPVRIQPDDFEVYHTQALTQCATVIMLDMSFSMMMGGRFHAGRKVAIALDSLIRTQFPKDELSVVAFSYFVLTLKPEMLFDSYWVEYGGGTNFEEALRQARHILARNRAATKQILMITDGEPTTYNRWYYGREQRGYGTGLESTMREVARCTQDKITINTFIMDRYRSSLEFVKLMTRLNKGRAFFTTPDELGKYILLDYVSNKRKVVR